MYTICTALDIATKHYHDTEWTSVYGDYTATIELLLQYTDNKVHNTVHMVVLMRVLIISYAEIEHM